MMKYHVIRCGCFGAAGAILVAGMNCPIVIVILALIGAMFLANVASIAILRKVAGGVQ